MYELYLIHWIQSKGKLNVYLMQCLFVLQLPLSSDKIAFLQTPLLNLDLNVKENGVLKPVTIEMDKEELQTLIHSLEAANKVVLKYLSLHMYFADYVL